MLNLAHPIKMMWMGSLLLLFAACHNSSVSKISVSQSSTRSVNEFERVYIHYQKDPADSLKLKAAHFLIENLKGRYYYQGTQLDEYMKYLKLINLAKDQGKYIISSFTTQYGPYTTDSLKKQFDTDHVKAQNIIGNIDMAFKVWREQPWGKDITWDQFLEYILPFRLVNGMPEYNREQIYKTYNPLLDSVRRVGGDAVMACKVINDRLKRDGWLFTERPDFMPHFPAAALLKYRTGSCREMADAAVYIMRSVGIPVGIDFLEQWPYRTQGHNWNIVLNKAGKITMFMGADESPGIPHKPGSTKAKIYRDTYALNPASLAMQNTAEDVIPAFLKNPRIKDVTDEYAKCYLVPVRLLNKPSENSRFAYLAVFNNQDWVPVAWTNNQNGKAVFSKVEGGIAYLPCFYGQGRKIIPANYPLILNKAGAIKLLKPDEQKLNKTMIFSRIFPIIPDKFDIATFGGRFQGANRADFSDAEDLYVIGRALPFWNTAAVNSKKKFRFVRYLTVPGQRCSIAELAVYKSGIKLTGGLIGTKDSYNRDADFTIDKATDNDLSTHFDSKYATGTWVGLDFKEPQHIDSIKFAAPCNETTATKIVSGNVYELFYWGGAMGWVSKGNRTAVNGSVVFNSIPSNALYLLYNHSRDKNAPKRIFTYEKGRQVWY